MLKELQEVLRLYAAKGVGDWQSARGELKTRAKSCLPMTIAEDEKDLHTALNTYFNKKNPPNLSLIPMPDKGAKGIDRAFFVPIIEQTEGQPCVAFDLVLLVHQRNVFAFRFESAHSESNHDYAHAQISRRLVRKTIPICSCPTWWPDAYPAFPFVADTPLRLFLAMAISVHGNTHGMRPLLRNLLVQANRAGKVDYYNGEANRMLGLAI